MNAPSLVVPQGNERKKIFENWVLAVLPTFIALSHRPPVSWLPLLGEFPIIIPGVDGGCINSHVNPQFPHGFPHGFGADLPGEAPSCVTRSCSFAEEMPSFHESPGEEEAEMADLWAWDLEKKPW